MVKLNARYPQRYTLKRSAWLNLVLVMGSVLMVLSANLAAEDEVSTQTFNSLALKPKALFQAQCASCHGDKAEGTVLAPSLAGQQSAYLERQLTHFKNGLRGEHSSDSYGAQMVAIAAGLESRAIAPLAAYLAELTAHQSATPTAASIAPADLRKGYTYYHSTCGGCHGGQAEGNPLLNAPRLDTLSTEYLHRQLDYFAKGVRGAHQQDRFGRQMAMMSKSLDQKTLADVITFIATQPQ